MLTDGNDCSNSLATSIVELRLRKDDGVQRSDG